MIQNSVDAIDKNGAITISSISNGNYLFISLTDDGCGISEPQNIFDPSLQPKHLAPDSDCLSHKKLLNSITERLRLFHHVPAKQFLKLNYR